MGNDRRRRRFAGRHVRDRFCACVLGSPHAVPEARQPLGPCRRGRRRVDVLERRPRCGDRWRPPARRSDTPQNVSGARARRGRPGDRNPDRRRPRRRSLAGAADAERPRRLVLSADRGRGRDGSDERLFHDPARDRQPSRAASVSGRLQDPGRRHPVGCRGVEDRRDPLPVSQAHSRRSRN